MRWETSQSQWCCVVNTAGIHVTALELKGAEQQLQIPSLGSSMMSLFLWTTCSPHESPEAMHHHLVCNVGLHGEAMG